MNMPFEAIASIVIVFDSILLPFYRIIPPSCIGSTKFLDFRALRFTSSFFNQLVLTSSKLLIFIFPYVELLPVAVYPFDLAFIDILRFVIILLYLLLLLLVVVVTLIRIVIA